MRRVCFASLVAALLCLGAAARADEARNIVIGGAVEHPLTLTPAQLRALPPVEVSVTQQTDHGPVEGKFRGALLWTLIGRAGLADGPGKNAYLRHSILVTSGRDGYAASLGEGEIDPKLEGKQVILAYEKDGAPLADMRLVVPGDAHASRGVQDVATIEVQ